MKKSMFDLMFHAIWDRNLYGFSFFFRSLPFLGVGLVIQYYAYYISNPQLLLIYVTTFIALIALTALFAKNFKKSFHPMQWWLACLFFYASILSKAFAFVGSFESTIIGFLQRLLVLSISEITLFLSLIAIVALGQRISLRRNVGLTDNFFDKGRNKWESELEGFPNLSKILESLHDGRYTSQLFDAGYFNLAVLWSCNVMEKAIDAITNGMIEEDPEKRILFRNEERHLPYPTQLKNMGYEYSVENGKKFDGYVLWHEVRNRIAHYNHLPTYDETNQTIKFLVAFVDQMPSILNGLST